jgi:hypothetical protein
LDIHEWLGPLLWEDDDTDIITIGGIIIVIKVANIEREGGTQPIDIRGEEYKLYDAFITLLILGEVIKTNLHQLTKDESGVLKDDGEDISLEGNGESSKLEVAHIVWVDGEILEHELKDLQPHPHLRQIITIYEGHLGNPLK